MQFLFYQRGKYFSAVQPHSKDFPLHSTGQDWITLATQTNHWHDSFPGCGPTSPEHVAEHSGILSARTKDGVNVEWATETVGYTETSQSSSLPLVISSSLAPDTWLFPQVINPKNATVGSNGVCLGFGNFSKNELLRSLSESLSHLWSTKRLFHEKTNKQTKPQQPSFNHGNFKHVQSRENDVVTPGTHLSARHILSVLIWWASPASSRAPPTPMPSTHSIRKPCLALKSFWRPSWGRGMKKCDCDCHLTQPKLCWA